jgi:2-polyprenyl-3-methyl-5-hydroxy-6-metoxy-1,4-benzoquinol methylase
MANVLKQVIYRLKDDPLGLIKRVIFKAIIGPLKYGKQGDYDAANYWNDRYKKYGCTYRAPGDEGLSEEENRELYARDLKEFEGIILKQSLDFPNLRVLDIGCGTGLYTELMRKLGVKNYLGLDITDIFFEDFKKKYPGYNYIKKDITIETLDGQFDLILMIDVTEHIVTEEKFTAAMDNVKRCLAPNGMFIVSPITDKSKKHMFYVHMWALDDFKKRFDGYALEQLIPFRTDELLIVKNR